MILHTKYVVPVDGPPIKNGAVRIEHGRIVAVAPLRELKANAPGPMVDYGDAVALPGLVNAHTHLELTNFAGLAALRPRTTRGQTPHALRRGQTPPGLGFVDWLERLGSAKRAQTDLEETLAQSAREGLRQSLVAGVTTVGDIASVPHVIRPVLRNGPLRVVSFGEVIAVGGLRDRLGERLAAAVDTTQASECLTIGLSPHAPYSVEAEGLRACVDAALVGNLRLCVHLAESREEVRFSERGDGPLRGFLERLGIWDDSIRCPRMRPVPLAETLGVIGPRTVLAHCNYVSDDEIRMIADGGAHVAYCPRTNAAFEHPPHRFRDLLEAGVNVCVGTDSLASNPSLSVLDELRYLARLHQDVEARTLLEMGTIRGARALGLDGDVGSLTPRKWADITVVPLSPNGPGDPVENVLRCAEPVRATVVRGRLISAQRSTA